MPAPRVLSVFWPIGKTPPQHPALWRASCTLLVIPLTAVIHHAFRGHRCMLNQVGQDYNLQTIRAIALHDASLPWAILCMIAVYQLGKGAPWIRRIVVPAFAASIPLTVWLWDIPFTRGIVHRHFHDGQFLIAPGIPLNTLWIYGMCLAMYVGFQVRYMVSH